MPPWGGNFVIGDGGGGDIDGDDDGGDNGDN